MENQNQFQSIVESSNWFFLGKLPNETKEHAIYRLHLNGLKYYQIQYLLNVSPNTISYVLRECIVNDEFLQPPEAKRGRPKKVNISIEQKIQQETEENPRITAKTICSSIDLSISYINIIRNDLGFRYLPPKKRTDLSIIQIENRIRFGYSLYAKNIDFKKILFSDESKFSLFPDHQNVWRKRGSKNDKIYCKKKFYNSIMIFGIIGYNYKSELVISKIKIDSEQYCFNIIKSGVIDFPFPDGNRIFQQDGAKAHMSTKTILWLNKRLNLLNHWPSNSPDLSPIENVWGLMDQYVSKKNPEKIEDLQRLCLEFWNQVLSFETINKLIDSFQLRINEMLYRSGENINDFLRNHLKDNENDLSCYPSKPDKIEIFEDIVLYKNENLQDPENFDPSIRAVLDKTGSPTKKVPWTPEEDDLLRNFIFLYGHRWENAPLMFGSRRTPSQLRYRHDQLRKSS